MITYVWWAAQHLWLGASPLFSKMQGSLVGQCLYEEETEGILRINKVVLFACKVDKAEWSGDSMLKQFHSFVTLIKHLTICRLQNFSLAFWSGSKLRNACIYSRISKAFVTAFLAGFLGFLLLLILGWSRCKWMFLILVGVWETLWHCWE